MSSECDVIVIGTGIAGLTAARLSAEQGFSTIALESNVFGGLVLNVNELEGEVKGSGAELASGLLTEISDLGVENLSETVAGLSAEGDRIEVSTDAASYRARAVIIASGASLRRLGIPGEMEFDGRGVAQCADCDGPLYQGKVVAVIGGGDAALQEAKVLAGYAGKVHLVHRGTEFSARPEIAEAARACTNIDIHWRSAVEEIAGGDAVESIRLRNLDNGTIENVPCSGVFAYVGLEPNASFVPPAVTRDGQGALVTDEAMHTALPGVYAIGAVRAGYAGRLKDAIAEAEAAVKAVAVRLGK